MKYAVASLALFVAACGPPPITNDAGPDASVTTDASVQFDAGPQDSGADAGTIDAGLPDAGDIDSPDAGEVDAGEPDAGAADAGLSDAGSTDAGDPDAGVPDAGTSDAGDPDAGPPIDAGFDAGAGCPVPTMQSAPFVLRAMAANLTSGTMQAYDPGHGIRIINGVQPDVIMLQEFNYGGNSTTNLNTFVNALGSGYFYQRGAGSIPNGVISRYPIIASGEWVDALATTTRNFTWARIDLPGPADLWVVSVHLLTSSPANRNIQGGALIANLNAMVPATDWVLLGGDLNTDTVTEPVFSQFSSRLVVAGPYPADQNGNTYTSAPRTKPYDHVLASPCLSALQIPSVIGTSTYDAGAVIDTRIYTPLTDIAPALSTDSAATGMQHMGVVKDFLIQP